MRHPVLCKVNAIHRRRETREFGYGVYQETIFGRTVSHLLAPYGATMYTWVVDKKSTISAL